MGFERGDETHESRYVDVIRGQIQGDELRLEASEGAREQKRVAVHVEVQAEDGEVGRQVLRQALRRAFLKLRTIVRWGVMW